MRLSGLLPKGVWLDPTQQVKTKKVERFLQHHAPGLDFDKIQDVATQNAGVFGIHMKKMKSGDVEVRGYKFADENPGKKKRKVEQVTLHVYLKQEIDLMKPEKVNAKRTVDVAKMKAFLEDERSDMTPEQYYKLVEKAAGKPTVKWRGKLDTFGVYLKTMSNGSINVYGYQHSSDGKPMNVYLRSFTAVDAAEIVAEKPTPKKEPKITEHKGLDLKDPKEIAAKRAKMWRNARRALGIAFVILGLLGAAATPFGLGIGAAGIAVGSVALGVAGFGGYLWFRNRQQKEVKDIPQAKKGDTEGVTKLTKEQLKQLPAARNEAENRFKADPELVLVDVDIFRFARDDQNNAVLIPYTTNHGRNEL
jgi:hypothetical protein